MAIFRGVGDATGNAAISEIENLRSDAQLAATEAEDAQGYAEEWANKAEDSLVSTAAGGDGVDDYSALHWSIKSSDSATLAIEALDEFTDLYLGAKATEPTLDNDGDALQDGALYFNTTSSNMFVYDLSTTTWLGVSGEGFLVAANNLSDLTNATTARSNLGVEIGVDVQAYDATIVTDSDIGVSVQGYDVDTAKYDDVTANFTGTLQNGGSNVVVDSDKALTAEAEAGINDVAFMTPLKTKQAGATFFAKHIAGLVPSNAADADHDITISAGVAVASNDNTVLQLASPITKQIDAAWIAGDNAGGLFTGTVAANTTYHLFIIENDSTGAIDAGFDTTLTASNRPAGYTNYRRVASFLTDVSANIIGFTAVETTGGVEFSYNSLIQSLDDTTPATAQTNVALSIPSGVEYRVKIHATLSDGSGTNKFIIIAPVSVSIPSPSASDGTIGTGASAFKSTVTFYLLSDTSSQIKYRSSNASVTTFFINTLGYIDFRRA